jgi:hypothetical protein
MGGDSLSVRRSALDHNFVMDVCDYAIELAQGMSQDVVGGCLRDVLTSQATP